MKVKNTYCNKLMQNICNSLLNCLTGSCMSLVSSETFYITKSFSGIRKPEKKLLIAGCGP